MSHLCFPRHMTYTSNLLTHQAVPCPPCLCSTGSRNVCLQKLPSWSPCAAGRACALHDSTAPPGQCAAEVLRWITYQLVLSLHALHAQVRTVSSRVDVSFTAVPWLHLFRLSVACCVPAGCDPCGFEAAQHSLCYSRFSSARGSCAFDKPKPQAGLQIVQVFRITTMETEGVRAALRVAASHCSSLDSGCLQVIDLGNLIVPELGRMYDASAHEADRGARNYLRATSALPIPDSDSDYTDDDDDPCATLAHPTDGVQIASLHYRAPEALACMPPFTAAVDMWALGVSLIEVRAHTVPGAPFYFSCHKRSMYMLSKAWYCRMNQSFLP